MSFSQSPGEIKDLGDQIVFKNPLLYRRGIPGVNSDAYHFGYLEDQATYKTVPPERSKYDPLFEALYIFGALLFAVLILTGAIFGLREYTYSMRKRRRLMSAGSVWSATTDIPLEELSGKLGNSAMMRLHSNPAYPHLVQENGGSSSTSYENVHQFLPSPDEYLYNGGSLFTDARDEVQNNFDNRNNIFGPIDIVQNSLLYSLHSLDDLFSDHDLLKSSNLNKKIYSIRELNNLKPPEFPNDSIKDDGGSLKMDNVQDAVRLSAPVENISFRSAWTAEKTLTEIASHLTHELITNVPIPDKATKQITILRFVAIAANSNTLKNSNIFLPSFNKFVESIIDSGIIFELVSDANSALAKSLMEVILQYCYAHWTINAQNEASIQRQFAKWKMNSPQIQPHHVIFRYLTNLELGIHLAGRLESNDLKILETKIITLLIHVVSTDHCNDYLGFLPIVAQAIEYAERPYSQALFYNLTYRMVKKHATCCMEEYLKDQDSDLKSIVQAGFWIKNDPAVRSLAEKTHMIVLNSNPKAMSWWKEIDGGRIYLTKSPRDFDLKCNTADIQNMQKVSTPGSWVLDFPKR